jgi:hypothetical protein
MPFEVQEAKVLVRKLHPFLFLRPTTLYADQKFTMPEVDTARLEAIAVAPPSDPGLAIAAESPCNILYRVIHFVNVVCMESAEQQK